MSTWTAHILLFGDGFCQKKVGGVSTDQDDGTKPPTRRTSTKTGVVKKAAAAKQAVEVKP